MYLIDLVFCLRKCWGKNHLNINSKSAPNITCYMYNKCTCIIGFLQAFALCSWIICMYIFACQASSFPPTHYPTRNYDLLYKFVCSFRASWLTIKYVLLLLYIRVITKQPENCENRNDPDLVQAFLKKWRVESESYLGKNRQLTNRRKR